MVTVRNRFTYVENDDGKRVRKYSEFPEIFDSFLFKLTNKRFEQAQSQLISDVLTESNKLFKLVVCNSMGFVNASPEIREYLDQPWQPLSIGWMKRKKNNLFWYGTGKKEGHLKDYLSDMTPSTLFGMPEINIARNTRARGYQIMTFSIDPYPLRGSYIKENMSSRQYEKLFGTTTGGDINEEVRPLISPAIQYMLENRIKRVAMESLASVMSNSVEVKINGRK